MEQNPTNKVWQKTLFKVYEEPDYIASPRGMEVRERVGDGYTVPMPAFIDLVDRKVNADFMFNEAHWIISGSNRVADLTGTMKSYANYSDDGITLSGAYGPKVIDQFRYVVDCLENDNDSRQAVMNIWRERPGPSKDIPCTTNMQFLIRDGKLNMVTTMRSNDIVLGYTYDVFSFSMVANAVRLLLKERGIDTELGDLRVNPGSLHIYERHYNDVEHWRTTEERDRSIGERVLQVMEAETYHELLEKLQEQFKKS